MDAKEENVMGMIMQQIGEHITATQQERAGKAVHAAISACIDSVRGLAKDLRTSAEALPQVRPHSDPVAVKGFTSGLNAAAGLADQLAESLSDKLVLGPYQEWWPGHVPDKEEEVPGNGAE